MAQSTLPPDLEAPVPLADYSTTRVPKCATSESHAAPGELNTFEESLSRKRRRNTMVEVALLT